MAPRCVLVVSLALCISFATCKPLPRKQEVERGLESRQDHQIDNVNEVHHDKEADEEGNRELALDTLPDQNHDGAGDGQLQQQQPPDLESRAAPDSMGHEPPQSDSDVKKMVFEIEQANKKGEVAAEKLVPDHLEVVRMEQDGHPNKDYHKEMFLGGQHDEFNSETIDNAQVKLRDIVAKADLNQDGYLSVSEMEKWILDKMMEHFDEAKKETELVFQHLDPDGDGYIRWKEYYVHFLLSRGFDADSAWKHLKDYDDSIELDQDDKDALVSYKFRWTDADKDPTDNKLSKKEFMIFRHPEHSKDSLDSMTNNVLRGIDSNEDGVISEDEFSALPPGEVEGAEFQEMDRKWQEERRKEFREIMDKNHDGKVDTKELRDYLDPTNPVQAKLEADSLMSLMDDNRDQLLSMDEIMKHSDIFISSKLVNFAANVHDEF